MSIPTQAPEPVSTELIVEHVPEDGRFRIRAAGGGHDISVVEYEETPGVWNIHHTWTEPARRGNGLADQVTRVALDTAREHGVQVVATCSYVAEWLSTHPDYQDLVGQRE